MSTEFDFKSISDAARDALLADPFFSGIVIDGLPVPFVLSEDPHDIVTMVTDALTKVNIAVIVLLPSCHNPHPNEAGPYFDDVRFQVKVYEMPVTNRAAGRPTAYQLAANVCRVLHKRPTDDAGAMFFVTDAIPVADPDLICYQIGIKTSEGLAFSGDTGVPQIGSVVATPASKSNVTQTVELYCSTPGAAVYYTLDGSYPSPLQASSQLYYQAPPGVLLSAGGTILVSGDGPTIVPLTIQPGQILRARAWLAGYSPSTPAEIQIQY